ncbi:uncharacterized protein LOC132896480 isoform X1 [Neoarius graeffei]|uniref:uncharacterized protein LOC132896480 isoform X1 n=1 Tax=Neoarius graeffei TaxID=443677 RepID=UPI00298D4223|nr:uncharacterized protein LOC132896480 isoform X1 [Neoarius graeffei]XP_060793314.1 uncharacterized protein LOC132896480 isoform X1 [Neoarius graeffei]
MIPLGDIIHKHWISFHCYADDTQLYVSAKPDKRHQLNRIKECVKDIRHWMLINFLLLNSDKTEVLVLGPHAARSKFSDYTVTLDGLSVSSHAAVKDLGVIIDPSLSFKTHIDNITQIAFFHLRKIAKIRNLMSLHDAEKLVHAFVTSRLDYCNALLSRCSNKCINKLQLVQNAAAKVLTRTRKYDHITPVLSTLHWLPIKFCIDYKVLLLTFKTLNGLAPQYLSELLLLYDPPRLLSRPGQKIDAVLKSSGHVKSIHFLRNSSFTVYLFIYLSTVYVSLMFYSPRRRHIIFYIRQCTILCRSCFQDHGARMSFLYSPIHCPDINFQAASPQRTHFYIRQRTLEAFRTRPAVSLVQTNMASEDDEKERLLPKIGTTTSVIWNWYRFAETDEKQTTPLCKVCLKPVVVTCSSTTNLFQHLKRKHPAEWEKCCVLRKESIPSRTSTAKSTSAKQSTLPQSFSSCVPYEKSGARWKAITDAITYFIATDMLPIYSVEKRGFQHMLKVLDARYNVPSRKYFSGVALPQLYNLTRQKVLSELQGIDFYAATTDLWSS